MEFQHTQPYAQRKLRMTLLPHKRSTLPGAYTARADAPSARRCRKEAAVGAQAGSVLQK